MAKFSNARKGDNTMEFQLGDRVFYTSTGEYGTVIDIVKGDEAPIIAQRDNSEWDMCYYPDGRLYETSTKPAIILVKDNQKEIDRYKVEINIMKVKSSLYKIKDIIKQHEDNTILTALENVKNVLEIEINRLKSEINKI